MAFKKRSAHNPKRKIRQAADAEYLKHLEGNVSYGGNPEHKRNPGDFGLNPPSHPRRDKTLCDMAGVFSRKDASELLKEGCKQGLISEQERNGFPQNIWAVKSGGIPLEAQLENAETGRYHGYPMPDADPFRKIVLDSWEEP